MNHQNKTIKANSFVKNNFPHFLKETSVFLTAIVFVVSGFFVGNTVEATVLIDPVMNEVYVDGTNEWIEILNPNSSGTINLNGYKFLIGGTVMRTINKDIFVPARGLAVVGNNDFQEGALVLSDTQSSSVTFLKSDGETGLGAVNYGGPGQPSAPGSGQSLSFDGTSTYTVQTATKGWFNDAGQEGKAPLLSTIDGILLADGIVSNIGELNDPSATPSGAGALYFEKAGKGKIVFESILNLTDQDTVTVLQSLGEKMEMSDGWIKFDSATAEEMNVTGAKIYMYGINEFGYDAENPVVVGDLVVKDDLDGTIDSGDAEYPVLGSFVYDSGLNDGQITFTTDHFTQFFMRDTMKPVVSSFDIPETADSLTVNNIHVGAHDNPRGTPSNVMFTESNTKPLAGSFEWSSFGASSYTYIFTSAGTKTLYAWVKDAESNISDLYTSDMVTITLPPALNTRPSFDAIADQVINEDASSQDISITNILPGDESEQTVSLSVASSDQSIIPNPTITGAGSTRTLTYAPVADASGTVTITVIADDGQSENNLFTRTFTITVNPVAESDAVAPVITLLGIDPVTIAYGEIYTDAGATALDDVDGDVTSNITAVIPVNTGVVADYTVSFNVSDSAGNAATQKTRTVHVVKADQALGFTRPDNKIYGDPDFDLLAVRGGSNNPVTFSVKSGPATVTGATIHITGVGTVTITASEEGNANYNAAPDVDQSFDVVALSLTGLFTADNKTYDGNTSAMVSLTSLSGVIGFDDVSLTGGTATFDTADAGVNKTVTLDGATLFGVDSGNYILDSVETAIADIIKADAIIDVINYDVSYDSAPHTATGTVTGVLGEDLSAGLDLSGTTHTDVGFYPIDAWTFEGGLNYNNYDGMVSDSISDNTAPVISLNGSPEVNLTVGETYDDAGVTALDDVDGDITSNISVGGLPIDTSTPNIYTVTFNVSDAAGNPAEPGHRTVNVNPASDTTAPDVLLTDDHPDSIIRDADTVVITATFTENDAIDEETAPRISVHSIPLLVDNALMTKVDNLTWTYEWDVPAGSDGEHTVSISAQDMSGNANSDATGQTSYTIDNTVPTATIDYSTTEPTNGSVTATLVPSEDVIVINNDGEMSYEFIENGSFTFEFVDEAGNEGSAMATIENIDTAPPIITLTGDNPQAVELGTEYVETGATTDDGSEIVIDASAVVNEVGSYTVTYNATDASGNVADMVTRTVDVVNTIDNTAPSVESLGDSENDYSLPSLREELFGATVTFSEKLSTDSRTTVENALTAGADKTLTFKWNDNNGGDGSKLRISTTSVATFVNDVVVNVSDVAGNMANSLLLVDSALEDTQTSPDSVTGEAKADSEDPEVVLTDPDQAVDITIAEGTDNPTIDVSSFTTDDGEETTGTLPEITINSDVADVVIPDNTVVTGPTGWDGIIDAPTEGTPAGGNAPAGFSVGSTVISIGSDAGTLTFDTPVTIILSGVTG
ncbi:MAG: DUF5011 domain-containing protein, partial [bacterium]|nr:DUF5011 domain-containing protein [bacterium]